MQRQLSWATALLLSTTTTACLPATNDAGDILLTDAMDQGAMNSDPMEKVSNDDSDVSDDSDTSDDSEVSGTTGSDPSNATTIMGSESEPETGGTTDSFVECDIMGIMGGAAVSFTVVSVLNDDIQPAIAIEEASDTPCFVNDLFVPEDDRGEGQARPGDFRISLRAFDISGEIPDESLDASLVGETTYTSQTYQLVDDQQYVLVLSDNLSREVLVSEPDVVPAGTYSVRFFNLEDAPVSLFAWDPLDLEAAPTLLVADLAPGDFTERLSFPLIETDRGFIGSIVPSTSDTVHPLLDPFSRGVGRLNCPDDAGIMQTTFLGSGDGARCQ